jgi:hypothetical protein
MQSNAPRGSRSHRIFNKVLGPIEARSIGHQLLLNLSGDARHKRTSVVLGWF